MQHQTPYGQHVHLRIAAQLAFALTVECSWQVDGVQKQAKLALWKINETSA